MKPAKRSFNRLGRLVYIALLSALSAICAVCLSGCGDKSAGPATPDSTSTPTLTPEYTVTVSGEGTGVSGGGSYTAGATVSISAGAPPSGKWFRSWASSSNGVIFADVGSAATTFTMPANSVEVVAGFEAARYAIDMVYVAGGTFTMGCTSEQGDACQNDERPSHSVTLSDYYIGKYEVTQGLWKAVMGNLPNITAPLAWDYGLGDNYPIYYVNWNNAEEFVRALNNKTGKTYRLPTEAEWEYAARGGASSLGFMYSGSNTADDVAWYSENNNGSVGSVGYGTKQVGAKYPNELQIYDMSGNVAEWVSDLYGNYSPGAQTNPTGASSETSHVRIYRGGGWSDQCGLPGVTSPYLIDDCRVSRRQDAEFLRSPGVGFRLAVSAQ